MALTNDILKDYLISKNLVSQEKLKEWLKDAENLKVSLEEYLQRTNFIPPEKLLEIKGEILNLPIKIFEPLEKIPQEILNLIPEESAKTYKIIPFEKKGNLLYVGVVEPENEQTKEAISFIKTSTGLEIKEFLISPRDFYRIIRQYHDVLAQIKNYITTFRQTKPSQKQTQVKSLGEELVAGEEAPIIKLVSEILEEAIYQQASDVHFEPMKEKLRVRFRIQGDLQTFAFLPLDFHSPIITRIKVLAELKLDETRIPQDGRFQALVAGREIDFRVAVLPTANGEKVAIRILDPAAGIKELKDLGLLNYHQEILNQAITSPFGMILITGPTGSGKTTTLYAILQILNKENVNIVSLEDPVEYRIDGVNQSQVRPEIGYSFANGLREILRQDPDIILVGEIRDQETAELAVHAALTGHLVLSTLHTNDALGTIVRLLDMGIPRYLLPSAVSFVEAQRLVKKLCPDCKEEKEAPQPIEEIIDSVLASIPDKIKKEYQFNKPYKIYSPKGCEKCNFRGYIGRTGIFEMHYLSPKVKQMIIQGASIQEIKEVVKNEGMIFLKEDGIIKALLGLVSIEEIIKETK